ncbi:hypothetical protein PVL29_002556 [Vitis rotundifolia]|uniref:Uncharacterized protein n=1 Tax=Vitis rotundifolia TaxID=103349 RepID=A0AA39AJH7_VITRO|nr:hypothetical protein PVL29_002556 [Vitis rotundifolia]
MALHPDGPHPWLSIKLGNSDYHLQRQSAGYTWMFVKKKTHSRWSVIVKAPSEFNFGLSEVHLCKHPVALPISLVPSFMEQGKLANHLSEQGKERFYVEHKCIGFGIDPERVSGFEKECSCFEGNFLVPKGLLRQCKKS